MKSFESQVAEAKLLAEFTPDQQAFVDKLIAEFFKFFRGVKDADLKASFEKGDREALKIYREMIATRQQILDFINKKDKREKMITMDLDKIVVPEFDETIEPGNTVYYMYQEEYEKFKVISRNFTIVTIESVDMQKKVKKIVLENEILKDSGSKIRDDREVTYLAKSQHEGIVVGDYYKARTSGTKLKVLGFCIDERNDICVVFSNSGDPGATKFYLSIKFFKRCKIPI